jgi:raffinose/stachyose/melibiose transport system permease protein
MVQSKKKRVIMTVIMVIITAFAVFPFVWMILLSFKENNDIMLNPLSLPKNLDFSNYKDALDTLNYPQLYGNTFFICIVSMIIELVITFLSSFVIARMTFNRRLKSLVYGYLILGLSISPFILLFPVYRICVFFHISGKLRLVFPYVATSISFNTLLFTGYLRKLPSEIDEAAIIDGCNLYQLITKVIIPMSKPVIATIVIFNVLYIWNEFPFASVMLRDVTDYTLSMGASFFKGKYSVDYGGIIASSIMIIIPELIFYGIFQKNIVEGMTAGAVKG